MFLECSLTARFIALERRKRKEEGSEIESVKGRRRREEEREKKKGRRGESVRSRWHFRLDIS